MTVTLTVDRATWRANAAAVANGVAGGATCLVPVAKGNGYGFGIPVLTREAAVLGARSMAVGVAEEAPIAVGVIESEGLDLTGVVVLTPWRPYSAASQALVTRPLVIHTISRIEDLSALAAAAREAGAPAPRVLLEALTSMNRHGVPRGDLVAAGRECHRLAAGGELVFEGWTIHLPMAPGLIAEATELGRLCTTAAAGPLWFSHLPDRDVATVASTLGVEVRTRVGTRLWLGAPASCRYTGTVIDVHHLRKGDTYGYRQRHTSKAGTLLIISGGTSHGIGLEAPSPVTTPKQRAQVAALGGLGALGRAAAPFRIGGKRTWFAEPPHMQSSPVWLPEGVEPPSVGDRVPLVVRATTTTADHIEWV